MFKKLFGGAKPVPGAPGTSTAANQTINAMQSLGEREEQLEKKKELLQKRINDEMEKAREFTRQKKKSQALMCLKKKKMYEQQLERMDALISRVLEQRNMLEEQQTTIGVLGAMQDAAKAQKKTMQVRIRANIFICNITTHAGCVCTKNRACIALEHPAQ
jgi:DNA repair exonuclease SbcCD ATPase subunit